MKTDGRAFRFFHRIFALCLTALLFLYAINAANDIGKENNEPFNDGETLADAGKYTESAGHEAGFDERLFAAVQNDVEALYSEYSLSDGMFGEDHILCAGKISGEDGIYPWLSGELSVGDGYIFAKNNDTTGIFSDKLELITSFEGDGAVFTLERTKDGKPVFLVDSKYCTLDAASGEFVGCDYDEKTDSRGIKFAYPSYYGSADNAEKVYVVHGSAGFGFAKKETIDGEEQETVIAPAGYTKAYNFSEDRGCLRDFMRRLYFFDSRGKLRSGGLVNIIYGPEDDSVNNLGFYYYTEGLTRAIKKTFKSGKLISERQMLIDRDGDELPLPQDYSIAAYSDGVILLEKAGYRGYMDSLGAWMTDPVYTYAEPFYEGLAVIGFSDGKKGVMDKSGKLVVPMIFDDITNCSGGLMIAKSQENGNFIIKKLVKHKSEE